jgi:hypothetical protein
MRKYLFLALCTAACSGPSPQSTAASNTPKPSGSDITVRCDGQPDTAAASGTILTYSGGKSGTLTMTGAFGDMRLPATRTDDEGEVSGEKIKTIGIRAYGPGDVVMPDKAALENCLTTAGADPSDSDLIAYHLNVCQNQIALGASPVPIDASVTVAIIDGTEAEVFITRTFKEESAAAGGPMKLDSFPPLSCRIE